MIPLRAQTLPPDDPISAPVPPTRQLALNAPPVAAAASYSGQEDTGIWGTLLVTDPDSYQFTFFSTQPSHGTLVLEPAWGSFAYTPQANYNGTDSFQYWVSDGTSSSAVVTVTLMLGAVNDAPVVQLGSAGAAEGAPELTGRLSDWVYDVEGSPLSYLVLYAPDGASVDASGAWRFDPNHASYNGLAEGEVQTVSLVFQVSDGTLSTTGSFDWLLTGSNDAPEVPEQTFYGTEELVLSGSLRASDPDGDGLVFALEASEGGSVVLSPSGQFSFTPDANRFGSLSFRFTVNDGVLSSVGTAELIVQGLNDAPSASELSLSALEGGAMLSGSLTALASDPDGDELSFSTVELPAGFTLLDSGLWSFDPNAADHQSLKAGEVRDLQLGYRASDGVFHADGVIRLKLTGTNDAPATGVYELQGMEDQVVTGRLTDADAEGDTLVYSLRAGSAVGGSVLLHADGRFEFTPEPQRNGWVSFGYTVSDGALMSSGTVNIQLVAVNDPPQVVVPTLQTLEDTAVSAALLATDVEGSTLQFSLFVPPEHGTVLLNPDTGLFRYAPATDTNGPDSFVVRVLDAQGGSATVRVQVQVAPVNDAPRIASETLLVMEDQVRVAALPVSDPDRGDWVRYELLEGPQHGQIQLDALSGVYTYRPAAGYQGADSFGIRAMDSQGATTQASFQLLVLPVDDAPSFSLLPTSLQGFAGAPVRIGAMALADADAEAGVFSVRFELKDSNGASFHGAPAAGVSVQGSGGASLVASGPLDALNLWLAGAPVSVVPNLPGALELRVTATDPAREDAAALSTEALIGLRVLTPDSSLTPQLVSATPTPGASEVAVTAPLVLVFNQALQSSGQPIVLRDAAGRVVESFVPGADARATINGQTLSLDPGKDLAYGRGFSLQIPAGSLIGAGNGLLHAGTQLNFTTTWLDPSDAKSAWYPMVERLYVAYFGRPADPAGLAAAAELLRSVQAPTTTLAFLAAYDTNPTVRALLDSFGTSTESRALYAGSRTEDMVGAIYRGLLNREPDAAGLHFWSQAIDQGVLSPPKVALNLLAAAEANASTDGLTVGRKLAVAQDFSLSLDSSIERAAYSGDAAAALARATLAGVGRSTDPVVYHARVDDAIGQLVSDPLLLLPTSGADLLAGTPAADVLVGLGGDDSFVPGPGADTVNGGAGVDTVRYSGPMSAYELTRSGGEVVVSDSVAGRDGVDRLSDIEVLQFFDGSIDLRVTVVGVVEL